MIEKTKTAIWFLRRPRHWAHAIALARRKVRNNHDTPHLRSQARDWAQQRVVSVQAALASVSLIGPDDELPALTSDRLDSARKRVATSAVKMGGPGDINLLYAAVALSGAHRVVETGVAYGWSSFAILAALDGRPGARLVSVDMPYPKMNNEKFVGIVVPDDLRTNWRLLREPDRLGLTRAIRIQGGTIDLCHYDSDKSWWGRQYAYPKLWQALASGGVFISDDIQDNLAFAEFVQSRKISFAVTAFENKFVGIARKP